MAHKEGVNSKIIKDLSDEIQAIQLFSTSVIFSAAAVASSTILLFIPNLETLSLFFFIVGYRYGIKPGIMTIITSVTIFEMFASQVYGTGGIFPFLLKFPPFFLIMCTGVYFHNLKMKNSTASHTNKIHSFVSDNNANIKQKNLLYRPSNINSDHKVSGFSFYERILLAQTGLALTMIYDIFTSLGILVFVPSWEGFFITFITGLPFLIFHQLTNIMFFSTIPSIIIALDKARPLY